MARHYAKNSKGVFWINEKYLYSHILSSDRSIPSTLGCKYMFSCLGGLILISVWTQKVHYIPKVQASNIDKKNEWGVIMLCEAKRKVSINARTDKFGSSPPPHWQYWKNLCNQYEWPIESLREQWVWNQVPHLYGGILVRGDIPTPRSIMYISTVIIDEDNMGSIHYLDLTLYPYMSPRTNYRNFKRK